LVTTTFVIALVVPCVAAMETDAGVIVTAGFVGVGAVPVPLSATLCGLPLALSVICNVACRTPVALGVNVRAIAHDEPAATVAPAPEAAHVVPAANAKSPALTPLMAIALMFNGAVPVFSTVKTLAALVVFCVVLGNDSAPGGRNFTTGTAGAVPLPLSPTLCGLPLALSVICNVACRTPVALGVNVRAIAHDELAAIVAPAPEAAHVVPAANAKSPAFTPAIAMEEIINAPVPLLESVSTLAALVVF
jgi:hypothetical protein